MNFGGDIIIRFVETLGSKTMVHGTAKCASNVKNGEIGTARSARSVPTASPFRAMVVAESAARIMIRRQTNVLGTAIKIACDSDRVLSWRLEPDLCNVRSTFRSNAHGVATASGNSTVYRKRTTLTMLLL